MIRDITVTISNVCVHYAEAPRALHLTKSAYIRHIAPNVSSADILEVRILLCVCAVCVCVCLYVLCVFVCVHACMCVSICVVCLQVPTFVSMCVPPVVCVYVHVPMYVVSLYYFDIDIVVIRFVSNFPDTSEWHWMDQILRRSRGNH